jgi:hypothetical protein
MSTSLFVCALLIAANGEAAPPIVEQPELRRELLSREKEDQDARNVWVAWLKKSGVTGVIITDKLSPEQRAEYDKVEAGVKQTDQANTAWLKAIVAKQGWPTIGLVGGDGANAAWLLVQHADADPKVQRECLDLMAQLPRAQVSQSKIAYLTDRVLLAEGKKQVYATQFTLADGKWIPSPLEDAENVDQRRAAAGLSPLADYIRQLEAVYGAPAAK